MDQNQLLEAFKFTLSGKKEQMDQGQAYIENCINQPNFASTLMVLIDNVELDINLRQFALTTFKTLLEKRWKKNKEYEALPEDEKTAIKTNIIEAMIRVSNNSKLYKTYAKIIYSIASTDFPKKWPNVIEQINEKLSSSDDFNILFGCLYALKSISQVFEYQLGEEDRAPLEHIVNTCFGSIQKLVANIWQNYNDQTAVLMQQILKIFYICVNLEIPQYLSNFEVLDQWIQILQQFYQVQIPEQFRKYPQTELELRQINKIMYWRNKKSAAKILMRFVQKYSNDKLEGKNSKGFAKHFKDTYGNKLIDMFLLTLNTSLSEFVSLPTLHFSMRYIQMSLRIQQFTEYLSTHLTNLAVQVCVPLLALTQMDQQLFNNDPIEYMRKEEDFTQTMYNPKNAAMDLIQTIVKKNNNKHLLEIMQFFYQVLSTDTFNGQPLTLNQKDGILWAIGELHPDIKQEQQLSGQIEQLLEKFALPLFQSTQTFIRSRASWLYGVYGTIDFKNQQTITSVTQLMCSSILDKNLVTKTRSAIALNKFLRQEQSKNIIRTEVKNLVGIYLKLMEEVDSEDLVYALEGIIENFSEEVKEFSINLVLQLIEAFHRYDEKEDQDEDMYGEGEFAAAGCINAINKILQSNLAPQIYVELEKNLLPIVNYSLSEESDYIEEGLDTLSILIKKTPRISEDLYFYFVALSYMIIGLDENLNIDTLANLTETQKQTLENIRLGTGCEFTSKLLPVYKNVLQKDLNAFLQHKDMFGVTFVELMFKVVDANVKNATDIQEETDCTNIMHYFLAFIENNLAQKQVDQVVIQILEKTLQYINQLSQLSDFAQFTRQCYLVVCTCLIYNPELILQKTEQLNITQQLFQKIFESLVSAKKVSQHNDLELQKYLMGISQVLTLLPQEKIPLSLQNMFNTLMETIVFLTGMVLEVRECDEDEDENDDFFDDNFIEKVDFTDKYDSPLDNIDELIDLEEKLIALKTSHEPIYNKIISLLSQENLTKLQQNLVEGRKQYNEYIQGSQQN